MTGRLRVLLDEAIGERRALILRDGRPDRLLVERDGPRTGLDPRLRLGAQVRGRLRRRALGMAFVDLGTEGDATVSPTAVRTYSEGAALVLEITAEPRLGKGASAKVVGPAVGPPELLRAAPDLAARLEMLAPDTPAEGGPAAIDRIDAAVEEALTAETRLPGGGRLTIESTRALVAVDVDFADAEAGGGGQAAQRLNRLALIETARRLRLSGLAGLVVIDLIGAPADGDALRAAARAAFAPDAPGVTIGPVTRFGTLELVRPWRETPLRERLTGPDGRISPLTAALDLLRRLERAGRADPGGRLHARAAPEVVEALAPYRPALIARIGARFTVEAALAIPREAADVTSQ